MADFPDLEPKVAVSRHPLYEAFVEEWRQLIHVREGTGGFRDGTYLHAHPREWLDHSIKTTITDETGTRVPRVIANPNPKKPSPKLRTRRNIASYTNHAASILDTKKAALFRESPVRRVGDAPSEEPTDLEKWWQDVDGRQTPMDTAMPAWWDLAATLGHVLFVFELPDEDRELPFVRVYTPLDVLDWLEDEDGNLTSVKLVEAVAPTEYQTSTETQYRIRILDDTEWRLYDFSRGQEGTAIARGEHGLGALPVVYLYGRRRSLVRHVGQSVLGDPRNHVRLFNLDSELQELLRNQTFTFINVPLGTGTDSIAVETAQQMMGTQTGTGNIIYTPLAAQVLSGDSANVAAYQEEIKNRTREIYREAGSPWESDSRDAEASKSLELKREELNVRLASYADECEAADVALTKLWYRWKYGPDLADKRFADDAVTIQYPDKFGAIPFEEVVAQVQSAQSIGMPPVFMKALRKNIVAKFEGMGSLSERERQEIMDAIDEAPDDPTPQERMRQRMELMEKATAAGGRLPRVPKADEDE